MVQRDFNQNDHCTQLTLLYSTINIIKIKLIFSKTEFDYNSYISPRMVSLLFCVAEGSPTTLKSRTPSMKSVKKSI